MRNNQVITKSWILRKEIITILKSCGKLYVEDSPVLALHFPVGLQMTPRYISCVVQSAVCTSNLYFNNRLLFFTWMEPFIMIYDIDWCHYRYIICTKCTVYTTQRIIQPFILYLVLFSVHYPSILVMSVG